MPDELAMRALNRNYMVDWQDRLFQDSVLVRFEDGKLNPKATFTALAAFLDLPYTKSMTYCSRNGERDPESLKGNDRGFDPAAIYRTYEKYLGREEREMCIGVTAMTSNAMMVLPWIKKRWTICLAGCTDIRI